MTAKTAAKGEDFVVVNGREYLAACAPKSEKKSGARKSFEVEREHRAEASYQGLPWEDEF